MAKAKRKAAKVGPRRLIEVFEQKMNGKDRYDLRNIDKIGKDISKVEFDFENCNYGEDGPYPSMRDSTNGIRSIYVQGGYFWFIGVTAGGDWEYPVYFIIYLDKDGHTLRGYIPKDGNVWNYKTKSAFGNDEDADHAFLKKYYKDNVLDYDEEAEEGKIFCTDDAEMMLNEMLIERDIYNRIEVV